MGLLYLSRIFLLKHKNFLKGEDIKYHTYYNNKLPLVTKPEDYGHIIYKKDNMFTIARAKVIFIIEAFNNYNIVKYFKNGNLIFN